MKNFLKALVLSVSASLILTACGTTGPIGEDPSIEVLDVSTLPPPLTWDNPEAGFYELIRPGDVLAISVFGVEELTFEEIPVGQDGQFDFPLIGTVQADRRTVGEVTSEIEARLADTYVRNPDVQAFFVSRDAQVATIGGEVDQPGQFPIVQPTTLLQAVAIGEGRTQYATSEVFVFRQIDGQRYIGVYDLEAIGRGNYPDPQIYPQDIIVVGESPATRRFARIAPLVPLITSPLILLERALRRTP